LSQGLIKESNDCGRKKIKEKRNQKRKKKRKKTPQVQCNEEEEDSLQKIK